MAGLLQRIADRIRGTAVPDAGKRSVIEAGSNGRRWTNAGLRTPSTEIVGRRAVAGARAAAYALNSPYGAALVTAWVSNLVADGPSIRPATDDAALRLHLIAAWGAWWDECDAEGLSDLGGFLQRVGRCEFVYGEAFVHMSVGPAGALRLRLWSPEQIDPTLSRNLENGNRIVAGVEMTAQGVRVAYHVRENHDAPLVIDFTTRRIPAEDVLHIFEPLFPGQVRGISRLTPVTTRLNEVDRLEDALLSKANTAALFGGVLYNPDAQAGGGRIDGADQNGDYPIEPGTMIFAPPGYSVEFTDPPSTEGAVDFLRSQIRSVAAGVGIPFELVSADLSQVNYSSARLGLLEFRARITALRRNLIVARLLLPVWKRWALLEALAGRLGLAEALTISTEFVFPGWAQIDPLKETNADLAAIKGRIKSRAEVIAGRGRDPEAVDREIASDPQPAPEPTPKTAGTLV